MYQGWSRAGQGYRSLYSARLRALLAASTKEKLPERTPVQLELPGLTKRHTREAARC